MGHLLSVWDSEDNIKGTALQPLHDKGFIGFSCLYMYIYTKLLDVHSSHFHGCLSHVKEVDGAIVLQIQRMFWETHTDQELVELSAFPARRGE